MGEHLVASAGMALGALALSAPLLGVIALIVWTERLTARGRSGLVPVLTAGGVLAAGVTLASTAPPGLEGLGHVLIGGYLAGAGGLAGLGCGLLVVVRGRQHATAPGRGADVGDG